MENSLRDKVIIILVIIVALLGSANLFLVMNSINLIQKLSVVTTSSTINNQQPTTIKTDAEIYECKFNVGKEKIKERGYIKKEKDDRDLGSEFMFTFYFDEPFLLWVNGSGSPQYAKSIELYDPEHASFSIDDFLDRHVELAGDLTWGYAESRVIQPQAIRIL